ncbi:hypothetical protein [Streptomyces sp. NPDC014734]|uniref:hypothetical protein n=1 Tax=Streptomyces sp. NPDC014734 TaxID=3364886 RepID=UPI0036FA2639
MTCVITASKPSRTAPFAGLIPQQSGRSVTRIRAGRPGLRFHIDTILGTDDLLSVIGGVGHESHPGIIDTYLIWLIRLNNGQMAEMWAYQRSVP